jgi:DNA-binding MarR family transcriptional regulator
VTAIPDLSAHIGYLLRMISNAVSHEFARGVATEGITVAEWSVLRSLYGAGEVAPSALARKMGMTKGAISKLADRLAEKGLIERAANPDDKRAHCLSLSVRGNEKVPVLAALADQNDAAFFAVLTGEEQQRLRRLLHTLIDKHGLSGVPID